MINVIRVQLQNKIQRFPMFTVQDHLSFLMTSADMNGRTLTEQQLILDEVLDILYPNYSKTEQEFIFTKVYCASFGKNAIKIAVTKGNSVEEAFMHITDYQLQNEYKVDGNITLGFNFPKDRKRDPSLFLDCIAYVINEGQRYEWNTLSEITKDSIVELVDMTDITNIIEMLTKSCVVNIKKDSFSNLLTLFKILFSSNETTEFFKTNYLMNKNKLEIDSIMNRTPMERSIYIAMLTEDLKRQHEKT